MPEVEILIVGAGPAGAVAALNLSGSRRVAVVERRVSATPRIGESLVPAARRLLTDMGLWESFLSERHEPWHGKRAVWGSAVPEETDFLRDPDGHGWHLDRARFENWLREQARARGAELIAPAMVRAVEHDGRSWQVSLRMPQSACTLSAHVLIDAGGRARPIARKIGARVLTNDRLAAAWVRGIDAGKAGRGLTYVEATETGWWYTAPLPGHQRVLAFHTDSDLPLARSIREPGALLRNANASRELSTLLSEAGFRSSSEVQMTTAQSSFLEPPALNNWLAIGDAALSFDPISSQGLLNALFTGLAGAEAVERHLAGDRNALASYSKIIREVQATYQANLSHCYSAEQRWPDAPFWRRRLHRMGDEPEL